MFTASTYKYTKNIGLNQSLPVTQVKKCVTPVHTKAQLVSPAKTGALKGKKDLKKKAKNKFFSNALAGNLMLLDSKLNKGYRRTFFDCSNILVQEGKKFRSTYCNARWCNTCNRIRTAKMFAGYGEQVNKLKDKYFLTLTIPNVKGDVLRESIKEMTKTTTLIVQLARKHYKKPINGIRKLECTYNPERNDYHPHFHFIISGEDECNFILNQWMKRYSGIVDIKGQKMVKADDDSASELFKYMTKITTKTKDKGFEIYISALNVIYEAMEGLRTFQPFGNIKKQSEDIEELQSELYDMPEEKNVWKWGKVDWASIIEEEKMLSGYKPSDKMILLTTQKMII